MKSLFVLFIVLIFNNSYSQDSWIRIYQPSGWQIKSLTKLHNPNNSNIIFIQHNSNRTSNNPENGVIKKYDKSSGTWIIPSNGFLNTQCAWIIEPPNMELSCESTSFFMTSALDQNFVVKFLLTPAAWCPDANTYFTYNNGISYTQHGYLFGCGGILIFPNGGDIDPTNDNICYYGYVNHSGNFQPTIFKSTNKGADWFPTVSIPDLRTVAPISSWGNLTGGFIKVNPFNTNYIFTVHRDYMMLSTDAGYSFNSINIPPLKELCFDYSGNIIYGVAQSKIYKSLNNGLNWDSSDVTFALNTMEVSPDNSNIIYAGSSTGLYRSSNSGQNWYLYNNSFSPSKNVIGVSKDPGSSDTIIVSTEDAVYKVFRDQLTGVNQGNLLIPSSFKLSQNYPNPFNPNTVINYELPQQSGGNYFYNVKMTVYNILGNEVATLLNKKQNAGRYSVEFDGSEFASGNYFYRIEAGDFFEVKKMILLK